jgi:uncharacterized protein (TIGR03435 family)
MHLHPASKGLPALLRGLAEMAFCRQTLSHLHVFANSSAIIGSAVPVTQLVYSLSQLLDRPVTDKTDLKGLFDFRLEFAPVQLSAGSDPRPSVFAAIQEQLGLRLISTRGPVDVVIVDSIQKPTEN